MRRIAYERLLRITVVTFSCSRAWVQSAVSEYIALPSDSRQSTGRSGHATAAPVATGSPWPIAPPVTVRMSWRGEPAVAHGSDRPDVIDSSATIARSGSITPIVSAIDSAVSSPLGSAGRAGSCSTGSASGATRSASRSSASTTSSPPRASTCTVQPSGTRSLGLPGYAKKETGARVPARIRCSTPSSWASTCSAR